MVSFSVQQNKGRIRSFLVAVKMVITLSIENIGTHDNHIEIAYVPNQRTRKSWRRKLLSRHKHLKHYDLIVKEWTTLFALRHTKKNSHLLKIQALIAVSPANQSIWFVISLLPPSAPSFVKESLTTLLSKSESAPQWWRGGRQKGH